MRISCRVVALALLLTLTAAPGLVAQVAASPADTIRALEDSRTQAVLHADTAALARMVADDFVEIARTGQLRTKSDNIRDLASGRLRLLTLEHDSVTVRMYGDVGVLTAIARQTGTFAGFPFAGNIRYTRIFVRRDGRWQAVLMQQTPLP